MPNTLIPIQTYTLSSSTASVTFSNIPQNYTDLKIVVSGRSDRNVFSFTALKVQFNGTTSGYTHRMLIGDGSNATSVNNTNDGEGSTGIMVYALSQATNTASTFGNCEIYIPNYAGSNNKSVSADGVMETNATNAGMAFTAGLWSNSAAITSITLTPQISGSTFNFVANSTFTLYGVSNGVKAVGGTLTVAGGYAYHTFTSTGSFLPSQKITGAEFLIIAGGGGGNYTRAGGGGAGGLLNPVSQTLNAGNTYTALIGAGGTAGSATASTSGSSSVFANYTSIGGGRGGGAGGMGPGLSGGSGGGGGEGNVGGAGTQGQGNNGSNAFSGFNTAGAGGGAGAVGGASAQTVAGTGGVGLILNTWGSVTGTGQLSNGNYYYAGGGGGGVDDFGRIGTVTAGQGGLGGGGRGQLSVVTAGTAGTANTGGGGGGGGGRINEADGTGQPGGSGLIIIRYPLS
jgi:hypothetical protein